MSSRGDGEDLGPPPPIFQIGRRERLPRGLSRWLIIVAIALAVYIVLDIAKSIYADWLWFESLGYGAVYSTEIVTKTVLFLLGAIVFLALMGFNVALARRMAPAGYEE